MHPHFAAATVPLREPVHNDKKREETKEKNKNI
jgi:hypothetical protein